MWKVLHIQSNFVVLNKIYGVLVQGLNYTTLEEARELVLQSLTPCSCTVYQTDCYLCFWKVFCVLNMLELFQHFISVLLDHYLKEYTTLNLSELISSKNSFLLNPEHSTTPTFKELVWLILPSGSVLKDSLTYRFSTVTSDISVTRVRLVSFTFLLLLISMGILSQLWLFCGPSIFANVFIILLISSVRKLT